LLPAEAVLDASTLSLPSLRGFGELPDLWMVMATNRTLADKVVDATEALATGTFQTFNNSFDALLFDWAGVSASEWFNGENQTLYVTRVYRASDLSQINTALSAGNRNLLPAATGYILSDSTGVLSVGGRNTLSVTREIESWLATNGYVIPGGAGTLNWFDPVMASDPQFNTASLSHSRGSTSISQLGSGNVLPSQQMSFLEKLTGQDFSVSRNFFNATGYLLPKPSSENSALLAAAYSQVRGYYLARFLVAAAETASIGVEDDEGNGWLAAFSNLTLNTATDQIVGDIEAFVVQLFDQYRDAGRPDDQALDLLAIYKNEIPLLGAFVLASVEGVDPALTASALGVATLVQGGASQDLLTLSSPALALGYDGSDSIVGSAGSDVIVGGVGSDLLTGGNGNDTYIYRFGDGTDTIVEGTNSGDNDRLVLGSGLSSSLTVLTRTLAAPNDLTLSFAGRPGSILLRNTLNDFFDEGVEQVVFDDGTIWTRADLRTRALALASTAGNDTILGFNTADTLTGGLGNDTIDGAAGNDSYVYNRGDGNDTITEGTNAGTADKLLLKGIATSAVSLSRDGNHIKVNIANSSPTATDGGTVTLINSVSGPSQQGVEQIVFDDGVIWDRATMLLKSQPPQSTFGSLASLEYLSQTGVDVSIFASESTEPQTLPDATPVTEFLNSTDIAIPDGQVQSHLAKVTEPEGATGSFIAYDPSQSGFTEALEILSRRSPTLTTTADISSVTGSITTPYRTSINSTDSTVGSADMTDTRLERLVMAMAAFHAGSSVGVSDAKFGAQLVAATSIPMLAVAPIE
jgi:Ca2+-binding RTX toxin-like protein